MLFPDVSEEQAGAEPEVFALFLSCGAAVAFLQVVPKAEPVCAVAWAESRLWLPGWEPGEQWGR